MEKVVICWHKIWGLWWMAQCLPVTLLYSIPDNMRLGIAMKEEYTLVINQNWLLLQFLLYTFQLLEAYIRSNCLAQW